MKRAPANLVSNAMAYGGNTRVELCQPVRGAITVHVEDAGPGIPPGGLDRVFEPIQRLEGSRNRRTVLPITRNILRAHGGDVTVANLAGGGVRAIETLPGQLPPVRKCGSAGFDAAAAR